MQFSTILISAIAVIASVHGASIPAMDPSAPSPVALEARSYNDPNSGSNLEKRSPGYGHNSNFNNQMNNWNTGFSPMNFQQHQMWPQQQIWNQHQMWPQSHTSNWGSVW
ncbi:hypothetical protein BASA84_001622 [Batrachochytrium salamandrivorans]|nr:hypothetical protein BASA62_003671 [Batrachochytrium salamandrivorans]KAH9265466.1 hypothetical protein BASA84_001622 [Batrachochytrium salamandrivorans]